MAEEKRRDQQDPQEIRKERDRGMDKTLEDSYPASDPPSTIPDPTEVVPDPDQEDTAA